MNARLLFLAIAVTFGNHPIAAEPTVTNVRAAQKVGTKKVEIYYDVSGSTSPVYVSLQVSADGGTTFAVPANTLAGDIGGNITLGRSKKIVWDAGSDWPNQMSDAVKFRVVASDTVLAAPVLLSPANNSTKYYNAPAHPRHTFSWQAVEGADQYRIVVMSGAGTIVVDEIVPDLTYTPDMDLYTVTWWVFAGKNGVFGPSSPVWKAKVIVFF